MPSRSTVEEDAGRHEEFLGTPESERGDVLVYEAGSTRMGDRDCVRHCGTL
jgi:hypothetical protein